MRCNDKVMKKAPLHIQKWDAMCIFVLLVATLITRIVLIINTPFLYAQDAYRYLSEAIKFAYNGTIEFKVGMPFIFVLGVFIRLFGPFFGGIYTSRLLMLVASIIIILNIYKFGQKMSCRLLGLLSGLLAIFDPYFLKYSTVPYLEIPSISAGLIALYFIFSDQKLQIILAPIFFYFAVLTRLELYLPLVISIVVAYFYKKWRLLSKQEVRSILYFFFNIAIYILPLIYIYFFARSWGPFSLFQRIILFLTPELLLTTINCLFHFYDQQLLNQVIYLSVLAILGLSFLKTFIRTFFKGNKKKIIFLVQPKMVKNIFFSDNRMIALCLFLVSIIHIFVLTIFAYGYNWAFYVALSDMANTNILRKAVIITPRLHDRYLILLRLLISFPLAYPLVLLTRNLRIPIVHKNKTIFISLIMFLTILSSLYMWHNIFMWQSGLLSSKDASTSMGAFVEASEWLSERLSQNEVAIVPSIEVFHVLNPELSNRVINYKLIWDSAGVAFHERASTERLQKLHNYFNDFLEKNPKVEYLVRDWVNPYARYLFEKNDKLKFILKEVKIIPFTLSTGWSNKITIYNRAQYVTLFAIEFTSPPKEFYTLPPDAFVQYSSDGVTIRKDTHRVGFYLPLKKGINASKRNLLRMKIKLNIKDSMLTLVFYYDRNRDGRWSGNGIDYVRSVVFSQTEMGWIAGKWYTIYQIIPKTDDPLVQIGIILKGDRYGTLTLFDLAVYRRDNF